MLLVADADWVRDSVASTIIDPGASLESVDDPEVAVERLGAHRYRVVLVDMQVGSMGGMAITRMFKQAMALGEVETTPVVLLLDRTADKFLARRAGADGFVVKPFTAQEFRSVVTAATGG